MWEIIAAMAGNFPVNRIVTREEWGRMQNAQQLMHNQMAAQGALGGFVGGMIQGSGSGGAGGGGQAVYGYHTVSHGQPVPPSAPATKAAPQKWYDAATDSWMMSNPRVQREYDQLRQEWREPNKAPSAQAKAVKSDWELEQQLKVYAMMDKARKQEKLKAAGIRAELQDFVDGWLKDALVVA